MKNVDIEEPTSFLDHVYLGCTQRECKPNEKIIGHYNKMFESRIFCWGNWEITRMGQTSCKNFSVVLRYGGTCSKMCGTVLRIGKQEDRVTIQGFQSLFGRSPNLKGRIGKQRWIVRSLLPYWSKCLYLAIGRSDILWSVNKLARSVTKNGQKHVTNVWRDWSLAFSIHVSTNSIAMWETLQNNADWDYFKTPILQEILRIQNLHQRETLRFWKSNICTDQLDVQEAEVSVSQLHRIRDHIVGCWFAHGCFTCARLLGFGHWSAGNDPKNTKTNPSMHTGNRC